jgi:hypothetical protein
MARSTTQGGSNMILNGLNFYLDANNPTSYLNNSSIWYDISQYKNNFILSGTTSIPTYSSNGLLFDGTQHYAVTNNNYAIDNGTKTICGFIKSTDSIAIRGIAGTRGGNTGWGLALNYGLAGRMYFFNINGGFIASDGFDYPTNEWYHFAITYNSNTGIMKMYKNGVNTTTTTGNVNGTNTNLTETYIGGGSGHGLFSGYINSMQYYNIELLASEIQQNYNALKYRFGL